MSSFSSGVNLLQIAILMTVCIGFLLLMAVSIGSRASAQVSPAQAVDGSKHPELIPDETMYSLVFLNASVPTANPTDLEKATRCFVLVIAPSLDRRADH